MQRTYSTLTADRLAAWKQGRGLTMREAGAELGISVGEYNGDPSIAGRMAAYEDGMSKLLWPERRRGVRSSRFPDLFSLLKTLDPEFVASEFDADLIRVPKGTPINLLTNVHPKDVKSVLLAYVDGVLAGQQKFESAACNRSTTRKGRRPC
jgi:hypothetical protein